MMGQDDIIGNTRMYESNNNNNTGQQQRRRRHMYRSRHRRLGAEQQQQQQQHAEPKLGWRQEGTTAGELQADALLRRRVAVVPPPSASSSSSSAAAAAIARRHENLERPHRRRRRNSPSAAAAADVVLGDGVETSRTRPQSDTGRQGGGESLITVDNEQRGDDWIVVLLPLEQQQQQQRPTGLDDASISTTAQQLRQATEPPLGGILVRGADGPFPAAPGTANKESVPDRTLFVEPLRLQGGGGGGSSSSSAHYSSTDFLWMYACCLSVSLVAWVVYLVIPVHFKASVVHRRQRRAAASSSLASSHERRRNNTKSKEVGMILDNRIRGSSSSATPPRSYRKTRRTESFLTRFINRFNSEENHSTSRHESNDNSPLNVSLPNHQHVHDEQRSFLSHIPTTNNNINNSNIIAGGTERENEARRRRLLRAEATASQAAAQEIQRLAGAAETLPTGSLQEEGGEMRQSPPRDAAYNPKNTATTTPVLRQRQHYRYYHSRVHTAIPDAAVTTTTTKATSLRMNPNNNNDANSPVHPSHSHRVPDIRILRETLSRLQGRGIRLTAHGVHSQAKRVWIRYETDTGTLQWQTETAKKTTTATTATTGTPTTSTLALVRGPLRNVPMANVMYIDVGKKTTALLQLPDSDVPGNTCFSLLTASGSLDLQAHSRQERDALVSCCSLLLDQVHGDATDWRRLYEETAITTNSSSSGVSHGTSSAVQPSNASSTECVMMGKPAVAYSSNVDINNGSSVVSSALSAGLSDI